MQCGAALSYKTHALTKGNHSKKTLLFVQAALAYCHITVPSVHDLFIRCDLLIQCAECAMVNGCLPQTDTFLKAAISILPELPVDTATFFIPLTVFLFDSYHISKNELTD